MGEPARNIDRGNNQVCPELKRLGVKGPGHIHCVKCGYEGLFKRLMKGSIITDLGMWFFFGVTALMYLWPLIFVPIVYSIWRSFSRYTGCPECKGNLIVKLTDWRKRGLDSSNTDHSTAKDGSADKVANVSMSPVRPLWIFAAAVLVFFVGVYLIGRSSRKSKEDTANKEMQAVSNNAADDADKEISQPKTETYNDQNAVVIASPELPLGVQIRDISPEDYQEIEVNDVSSGSGHKVRYEIKFAVSTTLSDHDLKLLAYGIANGLNNNTSPFQALIIFFYPEGIDPSWGYRAKAIYAPWGEWSKAAEAELGDYSKHQWVFEFKSEQDKKDIKKLQGEADKKRVPIAKYLESVKKDINVVANYINAVQSIVSAFGAAKIPSSKLRLLKTLHKKIKSIEAKYDGPKSIFPPRDYEAFGNKWYSLISDTSYLANELTRDGSTKLLNFQSTSILADDSEKKLSGIRDMLLELSQFAN